MAVMLSTSLLEDVDKSRNYATLAKNQMVKARNIDSQNNTAIIIPNGAFNLTNVRY